MGIIVGPQFLTTLDKAKAGDLVVTQDSDGALIGIMLQDAAGQRPLIGVLAGQIERPCLRRGNADALCMNHGQEWMIVPVPSREGTSHYFEVNRRAGLLVLTPGGWSINFATSYSDALGRFNWEWRDLTTFSPVTNIDRGVICDRWRLWLSAGDRDRPRSEPLLEYTAQPAAAAL